MRILPINYAILNLITTTIPYFRSNGRFIKNCRECVQIWKKNVQDVREQNMLDCMEKMLEFIKNGVSFDEEALIYQSAYDNAMADDLYAGYQALTEENRQASLNLVNFTALNAKVIADAENLIENVYKFQGSSVTNMVDNFKDLLGGMKVFARNTINAESIEDVTTVQFRRGGKIEGMETIIHKLRYEEKNALSMGIPELDKFIGKFKPQKLYCTIALSGGFKSGFLENVTMGISKFNPNADNIPGLENTVLHITFENDVLQVFKRFMDWSSAEKMFSRTLDGRSNEEIGELAVARLAPKDDKEMGIIVKQYSRYKFGAEDLDDLVADYRNGGQRIVAIVVDYADLIKDPPYSKDEMEDRNKPLLVRKFEALKLAAQRLNVPIITAGQFNRDGERVAREAIATKRYPSPLMGGQLTAAHVAGGFGIKFHVETLIIQFRGYYNGIPILHMLLDKDRDNASEGENNSNERQLKFFKFTQNYFRISPDPNDAYDNIQDAAPGDPDGLLTKIFGGSKNEWEFNISEENKKKLEQQMEEARKATLELLGVTDQFK